MRNAALLPAVGFLAALSLAGCTPEARQDVGEAGQNIGQATEKSVEGTGKAVEKAGEEVAEETRQAGEAIDKGVEKTGQAVEKGAEHVGEAVGGTVRGAAKAAENVGESATLTPKIKNALIANQQIDASTIDVDTSGGNNTVVLKGTVRSAKEKTLAEQVARKALTDAHSNFKIRNELTVGGGAR